MILFGSIMKEKLKIISKLKGTYCLKSCLKRQEPIDDESSSRNFNISTVLPIENTHTSFRILDN